MCGISTRCMHRTGTLWEGRYRATMVHAEDYLLMCMRYKTADTQG